MIKISITPTLNEGDLETLEELLSALLAEADTYEIDSDVGVVEGESAVAFYLISEDDEAVRMDDLRRQVHDVLSAFNDLQSKGFLGFPKGQQLVTKHGRVTLRITE
jgi:hypothetical protein